MLAQGPFMRSEEENDETVSQDVNELRDVENSGKFTLQK